MSSSNRKGKCRFPIGVGSFLLKCNRGEPQSGSPQTDLLRHAEPSGRAAGLLSQNLPVHSFPSYPPHATARRVIKRLASSTTSFNIKSESPIQIATTPGGTLLDLKDWWQRQELESVQLTQGHAANQKQIKGQNPGLPTPTRRKQNARRSGDEDEYHHVLRVFRLSVREPAIITQYQKERQALLALDYPDSSYTGVSASIAIKHQSTTGCQLSCLYKENASSYQDHIRAKAFPNPVKVILAIPGFKVFPLFELFPKIIIGILNNQIKDSLPRKVKTLKRIEEICTFLNDAQFLELLQLQWEPWCPYSLRKCQSRPSDGYTHAG
ncbi:PREDICTED: uncharacterized protein LOC102020546 [Chinchilla lanigera]|uniref:uncharacterized protein LOC102020546 n=1 Tax=Chinchilla lanigera TaxID=34839 RepID=UPI00038ED6A7|nr:PREDICTED: uncharacterized protein LOC102020546 [Chinchilla lanigera]